MNHKHNCRAPGNNILVGTLCLLACGASVFARDGAVVHVASIEQLEAAVSDAGPGDEIVLRDGTYGKPASLTGEGAADKPVTVRAATTGGVECHEPLSIRGRYLTLAGFRFVRKGSVTISGTGHRITRCAMDNVSAGKWLQVSTGSREIEIDRCLFENKQNNRTLPKSCQLVQLRVHNDGERHHLHHNHFRNVPKGRNGNGYETVQLITTGPAREGWQLKGPGSQSVIERNLFEACDGESEIISVKARNSIVRGNTFRGCRGALVFRHGDGNLADGNIFLGNGKAGSGGIRMQGTDQIIVNNVFCGLTSWGVSTMNGTEDHFYVQVERARVAHNTFVNCGAALMIGVDHSKYPDGLLARDCQVSANIFYAGPDGNVGPKVIVFAKDRQPDAWTWTDNVAFGYAEPSSIPGVEARDPQLLADGAGLPAPTRDTPAVMLRADGADALKTDIVGASRPGRATVGAVQYRETGAAPRPLSAGDVGIHSGD